MTNMLECGQHGACNTVRPKHNSHTEAAMSSNDSSISAHRIGPSQTHSYYGKSIHTIWKNMLARCLSPNNKYYHRYGGRGIKVCARWMNFENFLADMGDRPAGLSLDRYPNNDGNYEPGNCRWATAVQQLRNYSGNRRITLHGQSYTISEASEHFGIPRYSIAARIDRLGWSIEDALTIPVDISRRPNRSRKCLSP
jgi:hypothetical protein